MQFKQRNSLMDPIISNTKVVKFIGSNLYSKLSWSEHIRFWVKKVQQLMQLVY